MTRDEALLKLLAVEPETKDQLIVVTGWPVDETLAALERLREQRLVSYRNGPAGAVGRRLYFVPAP